MNPAWLTWVLVALITPSPPRPASQTEEQEPPASLHRGWILESIGAPPQLTRSTYERVAADDNAPRETRAVALARLVELDRLTGATEDAQRHAATLRSLMRDDRAVPDTGDLEALRTGFREALSMPDEPSRTARIEALRAEVATADHRGDLATRRAVVAVIRAMLQERSDLERRLERELAAAQVAGDRDRMVEVRRLLRELTPEAGGRQALQRWMATWRVRVTRLLLEGEIAEAARIRRSFQPRAADHPAPPDLDEALAALDRLTDREDLDEDERAVLRELHTRLDEEFANGATDAVERALRQLPYRLR